MKLLRQRLVPVQQILGMRRNQNVDGVKQPLEIAFLYKRRSEVGHDEIANEHDAFLWQVNEHRVVSFSALDGDQIDGCASDLQLRAGGDGNVRPKTPHIVEVKAFTEKLFIESARRIQFAGQFFLVVASGVETRARIQPIEIGVASHVVPMSVGDEDGRQRRQARDLRPQRLIGGLRGIRPGAGIDADQFPSVLRYDEIVLGELEAGQHVHASGQDRRDAPRSESVSSGGVLGKGRRQRDGPGPILVAALL